MLTATEFHMREPLPLHQVQEAILAFCRGRSDVAVFGAQAVNRYVAEPRMSQDVDLLAADPAALAQELAQALGAQLHVALRVRELRAGTAYRLYQVRKEGSRHLADVRLAEHGLDDAVEHDGVRYVALPVLVAMKACALAHRRLAPKGATDLADLRRLLLAYPELRAETGLVASTIERIGGDAAALEAWREVVREPIVSDADADEGY